MGEVVHLFSELLLLQEFNSPLLEVLQQNDIVFADLVVHFTLQVVVGLQVARTHPERLPFHFVGHQTHQLHCLASHSALPRLNLLDLRALRVKGGRTEFENGQKLYIRDG